MILIFRHTPENNLGHYESVLREARIVFRYIEVYQPPYHQPGSLSSLFENPEVKGLIILGGPQNVDQTEQYPFIEEERACLKQLVERDFPIFAICLGSQLVARSQGAPVSRGIYPEVGWTPIELTTEGLDDPILSQLPNHLSQMQWHDDAFELPLNATLLAKSNTCPHQAYRIGKRVYAVQFHPEVDTAQIELWLRQSSSLTDEQKHALRDETEASYSTRSHFSKAMFTAYCQQFFLL